MALLANAVSARSRKPGSCQSDLAGPQVPRAGSGPGRRGGGARMSVRAEI